jgi:hypothetical protein
MDSEIRGKYFSFTSASVVAGEDLIETAETLNGMTGIIAKGITIITSGSLSFDINELGANSKLIPYTDTINKLSIGHSDNWIGSVVIGETSACPVSVEIIF